MNRIVVVIVGIIAVTVVGIVVWQFMLRTDSTPPVSTVGPAPQTFDTTGGQQMRPHWQRQQGAGDAATH